MMKPELGPMIVLKQMFDRFSKEAGKEQFHSILYRSASGYDRL